MMHECKRILNGEVAGTGLWDLQLGTASEAQVEAQGDEVLRYIPSAPGEVLGENVSGGQRSEEEDGEADASKEEEADESAAEHRRHTPVAPDPPAPENEAPQDPDATVPEDQQAKHKEVQVFQMTVSLRDNWLHRRRVAGHEHPDICRAHGACRKASLRIQAHQWHSAAALLPFRCPLQNEQWVHTSAQTGRAETHCSVQRPELPSGECQRGGRKRTVQNVPLLTATLPRARSLR